MNRRQKSLLVCNLLVIALIGSSALGAQVALATPGSWQIVSTPNGSTRNNYLLGVASISEIDAWAVGWYISDISGDRPADQTLTEHWNGTQWSIVSSPNPGTSENHLFGVTALASNNVWAVGERVDGYDPFRTLIVHWDGMSWSTVSSPNQGTGQNELHGVSAVDSSHIWAVGSYVGTDNLYRTLIEFWNGTSWSIQFSPDPGTTFNIQRGVVGIPTSDVAGGDAWAVGQYASGNGGRPLTQHWNGTQWVTISSPYQGGASNLTSVTAIASNDVWAVGAYYVGFNTYTFTVHWDGTQWSYVPSPNLGPNYDEFHGVSPVASNYVWAVGGGANGGPVQTLTEKWDGTQWSIVTSPNQGSGDNALYGASLTPGGIFTQRVRTLWAVGYYTDNSNNRTLAMKYNVCPTCNQPSP